MELTPQQATLCLRILQNSRNELCDIFPYLDGAFASLSYRSRSDRGFSTDGLSIFYFPQQLLQMYGTTPTTVRRGYLHMLLHCLFLHLFPPEFSSELWHLACDMAVEQMIEVQQNPRLALPENPVRDKCFCILGDKALPAEHILHMLQQGRFPFSVAEMYVFE